ncbi:p-aminobenzoyl-glutamate hydrolase subunit B [Symmachiella macrocystis]|uniref:Peptidase M20 domain-containing protein 2 n=1 Tax=Symmachiella macrocystis TaxID=2527985 RepID=A0A5C6B2P3_9PLAN|nr:amidohydrolase [Symmachiella macrocystis]TWU06585.1 p-aminobenzoyl-glutamate hydrolase subunit B [Symmachiella macrocystis]
MNSCAELKQHLTDEIGARRETVVGIGEAIMDAPELGFKEYRTADLVKETFTDFGLSFDDQLAITGVKAVLRGGKPGPTVALMGELDALQVPDHPRACAETGAAHACGHNAQIAGMLGAALGLSQSGVAEQLAGTIVFFAVPAEEYVEIGYRLGLVKQGRTSFLTGKQELIRLGLFDDVDMAVMIHSTSPDVHEGRMGLAPSSNGFLAKNIRFLGKASHAGGFPERGVNALNAAQLALSAINAQRETFRDEDCVRVHPIITKGGDLVNIVPAEVCLETYVRGRTPAAILDAASKVDRALRGAAMAMGCRVEIETVPGNLPLRNDPELAELFRNNAGAILGSDGYRDYPHAGGSTDAGDLSQIMPVLHPMMTGASGSHHQIDWHISDADAGYLAPAKTLATMAIDLLHGDATNAQRVMANHEVAMTKEEYLDCQRAVFQTEYFDGDQ